MEFFLDLKKAFDTVNEDFVFNVCIWYPLQHTKMV